MSWSDVNAKYRWSTRSGLPTVRRTNEDVVESIQPEGRPGVRVIAKQFGVNPGTVQRISRPFEQDAVAL
jgi:hypothetical protein